MSKKHDLKKLEYFIIAPTSKQGIEKGSVNIFSRDSRGTLKDIVQRIGFSSSDFVSQTKFLSINYFKIKPIPNGFNYKFSYKVRKINYKTVEEINNLTSNLQDDETAKKDLARYLSKFSFFIEPCF